jgi:CubicO group peptidase (beta-lactamase class C family)
MKLKITLLFTVLSISFLKAQTGLYVPELANFDTAMAQLMTQYNVPGGQLAITYQGRLVYNRGFGMADVTNSIPVEPHHIFRLASVSKTITGVAVMQLWENGQLNLDAPVFGPTGILNDAIYQNILDPRVNNITVRHLLEHGGGWDRALSGDPMFNAYNIAQTMGTTAPADSQTVIRFVLEYKMLDFDPGTQYQYSNFGYCVLGRVIEKITGISYEDYVITNILIPLGITTMECGHNLVADRLPNEVNYYDYPGAPLANSVYDNVTPVEWPNGGFNIEAMDANGGWVASAGNLCKLLVAIDKFPTKPDILLPATIDTMT